jgi:diaminopimelate epimerase
VTLTGQAQRSPLHEGRLSVSKHEGAGNDFLVIVDPLGAVPLGALLARRLCDRRRGIGADGLLRIGAGRLGAPVSMDLRNADGSSAEMSGNGIRCLVHAAVLAGLVYPSRVAVATDAGVRTVEITMGTEPGWASASVDMGPVRLGPEATPPPEGTRARYADAGNPHLVVEVVDPRTVDVEAVGRRLERQHPQGLNVEFIAPRGSDLVLAVWERGAGATLACGTGSCAAAAVARSWGIAGDVVSVANPGGVLEVMLGEGEDAPAVLSGPVHKVADAVIDLPA